MQIALWLALFFANDVHKHSSRRMWGRAAAIVAALSLCAVGGTADPAPVLPGFRSVDGALRTFLFMFTAGAALTVSAIAASASLAVEEAAQTDDFVRLVQANSRIRRATASLGCTMVAGIFSASWRQRAMADEQPLYSPEIVIVFGIYLSGILAAVLTPMILMHQKAALQFLDARLPVHQFDKQLSEERSAMRAELGLTHSDSIQAALAVLSPIIGAALSSSAR